MNQLSDLIGSVEYMFNKLLSNPKDKLKLNVTFYRIPKKPQDSIHHNL